MYILNFLYTYSCLIMLTSKNVVIIRIFIQVLYKLKNKIETGFSDDNKIIRKNCRVSDCSQPSKIIFVHDEQKIEDIYVETVSQSLIPVTVRSVFSMLNP